MWAQGSCELPTAKPRTRSFLPPLRGAFLDHDPPIGRSLPSKFTTISPGVQATRVGYQPTETHRLQLGPQSLEDWYPRSLLLTIANPSDPHKQIPGDLPLLLWVSPRCRQLLPDLVDRVSPGLRAVAE